MTGIIQEKQKETQPMTFNLALSGISDRLADLLKGSTPVEGLSEL